MKIDGTAARRPAAGKGFSALNRYSLKSLLMGSVAMVVVFCVLVVAYVKVSEGITQRMTDSLVNVDNVITDLCLKSTAAMIDARRHEKDFLLNFKEFGFDESRSRYITRLLTVAADIRQHMRRIRELADERETAEQTTAIERALDRYRQGVETLADKLGERGYRDVGVHGGMRAEALAMERLVKAHGSDRLLLGLHAVRRAEKYFVDRESDADILALDAALRDFNAAVAAARLPAEIRAEIRTAAERYVGLFRRYAQATEEIRTVKKEYLRSVQAIDPLLEQLYVGSLERVAAKRRAIERSTRLLSLPVFAVGGLVLVLTALFSLVVAHTVTRSVVESMTFAERIASGDLGSRLAPGGRNEFSSLAAALNTMAESLHEADVARRSGVDALRESEEKYRAIVETSTDWIWAIDLTGQHTFSNNRVRDILGIEPEELLTSSTYELLHPEDAPRAKEVLDASVSAGSGWQGLVLRWRHRDGSCRWVESSAVAVTDVRGNLVGFRGADRDITARLKLEGELVRTQKLEAIGTLAGGIAHDFNNLLQGLFGYISLAKLNLTRSDKAQEMLEQAERALGLSVNLTTQLLTFAKGGKPVKRRIALPALLEDPVKFALSGSRSDYRIVVDKDLWSVDADDGQLAQVIQNLVLNASEAMPQGGTVEIAARNEVIAAGGNPLVPAGGDFVRIDVRDAGAGITGQHLARIFDPYFTTKQKGSGLGLATSYSIVRSHNGFIDVTSRLGEGSVFSVFLPASQGAEAPEPVAVAVVGKGTGKVLLMDDDGLVREVAAKMIASLGHVVNTAANGEEAIVLFRSAREAGSPFDIVVLDLTVKNGMGGEETMRRLRELAPDIKAVVSSGYSDAAVLADHKSHGFSASLNKPYRLDGLRDCLLSLLRPSGAAAGQSAPECPSSEAGSA
jgi:PAS domain S-box-containing protein